MMLPCALALIKDAAFRLPTARRTASLVGWFVNMARRSVTTIANLHVLSTCRQRHLLACHHICPSCFAWKAHTGAPKPLIHPHQQSPRAHQKLASLWETSCL